MIFKYIVVSFSSSFHWHIIFITYVHNDRIVVFMLANIVKTTIICLIHKFWGKNCPFTIFVLKWNQNSSDNVYLKYTHHRLTKKFFDIRQNWHLSNMTATGILYKAANKVIVKIRLRKIYFIWLTVKNDVLSIYNFLQKIVSLQTVKNRTKYQRQMTMLHTNVWVLRKY